MLSGAYDGNRFSPLEQINRTNVQQLALQWVFQTGVRGSHETTPLVIDGVLYMTTPQNHAYAIDVRPAVRSGITSAICRRRCRCAADRENRGSPRLAIVCSSARSTPTGRAGREDRPVRWDVRGGRYAKATPSPWPRWWSRTNHHWHQRRRVRHSRLHRRLRRAETGKRRGASTRSPAPESPATRHGGQLVAAGGAPAWVTGAYDPELNMLYWGIGNPGPDFTATSGRATTSTPTLVALDADPAG